METVVLINYAKPKAKKYYLNWDTCTSFIASKKWDEISKIKNSNIVFDLEGFDVVNLDGLVWILLIGEMLYKNNNYLILKLPRNEMILKYIKTVGFDQVASKVFELFPKFWVASIEEYKTIKGIKIKKVQDINIQNVSEEFRIFIKSKEFIKLTNIETTGQIFWEYIQPLLMPIISELLSNIIEHSGEKVNTGNGYVTMFVSGKKINILIADAGVGFKKGLERKGLLVKDEAEAIKKAFLFKYFRNTKVEGRGIFEVLKCLRKLGGWLRIRSVKAEGNVGFASGDVRLYKEHNEDVVIKEIIERQLKIYEKGNFPGVQYSILIDTQNAERKI